MEAILYYLYFMVWTNYFAGGIAKIQERSFWVNNRGGYYTPKKWLFPLGIGISSDCEVYIHDLHFNTLEEAKHEYIKQIFTKT